MAEQLRVGGLDPARADLIEADIADRPDALARAVKRVRASPRARIGGLPPIEEAVSALGGFVWAYDDDMGPTSQPDSVWAELESALWAHRPVQLHAQVFGAYGPARAAVARARALDAFSHLLLTPMNGEPVRGEPPPHLLALTGSAAVLEPWLADPNALPSLEALTLSGSQRAPGSIPLDSLAALPALRHLGVHHPVDPETLLRHPLMERLETLDLFSVHPGPTLAAVEKHRDRLRQLRRLLLPGHLVSPARRAAFADLPARFLSHDRLEALGHDVMRLGYPEGHR